MNELFWLLMLGVNFLAVMAAYRFWGKLGLYIWIPLAAVLANIQVTKTIELFGLTATLGNIVYATSFLATDILSENYGTKDAKRAIGIGFFSLISLTVIMNIALLFHPAPGDFAHTGLQTIFGFMPRIAGASLIAYGISQFNDIAVYAFWKKKLPAIRYLWIRNNVSTMISQLIDTLVFTLTAFWGVFSPRVLLEIVVTTYFLKWLVAILDTPFLYLAAKMKNCVPDYDVTPKNG